MTSLYSQWPFSDDWVPADHIPEIFIIFVATFNTYKLFTVLKSLWNFTYQLQRNIHGSKKKLQIIWISIKQQPEEKPFFFVMASFILQIILISLYVFDLKDSLLSKHFHSLELLCKFVGIQSMLLYIYRKTSKKTSKRNKRLYKEIMKPICYVYLGFHIVFIIAYEV